MFRRWVDRPFQFFGVDSYVCLVFRDMQNVLSGIWKLGVESGYVCAWWVFKFQFVIFILNGDSNFTWLYRGLSINEFRLKTRRLIYAVGKLATLKRYTLKRTGVGS